MPTSAEAPLISHQEDDFDDELLQDDPAAAPAPDTHRAAGRLGVFVWLLTLSAGISGLLFGCKCPPSDPLSSAPPTNQLPVKTDDTGVISATLVSIGTSLSGNELSDLDKSIVTSCTSLFALVASPLSSLVADRFGRKPVILLADILFILGALVQAYTSTISGMVVGRSIVGAGVGAASFVTPLYLAELAPAAHRGLVVTMNSMSVTLGQVVAYIIGWIFAEHGDPSVGWRYMVGLGAIPALLQCMLLLFMPETPRWLVRMGRSNEARTVIHRTAGSDPDALHITDHVLKDIEVEVREEENSTKLSSQTGWNELFTVPKNRRALTIACLVQGLQQFCGFNSLMYFSATIFSILGFSIPTLTSLSVAATNFIFTVVALLLIDRIGRRRILLYSIPFMIIGLLLSSLGFSSTDISSGEVNTSAAITILISIMLYVAAYALGLGNVAWLQSELFPLNVRSLGSGLATATNWLANFIVGLTFLPLMDTLMPSWTFVLYAVICVAGWLAIWMIYPETGGLTLEEVTGLLEDGWGVR
ncbi:putative MFS myo-inositol transporter [Xylariaceae sp. FL0016]|nr:putative MFS myo-inositol transporter [Xylariaceae sp. FL0016]